jgi:hypothetical protein
MGEVRISEKARIKTAGFFKKTGLFLNEKTGGYFENPIVVWLLAVSFLANVCVWAALAIFIKPVDENIILHYNVYFGVDSTGYFREAYLLPISGLFILALNLSLGAFFFKNKERIASYALLMAAFMSNLSLIIASASIVIINY